MIDLQHRTLTLITPTTTLDGFSPSILGDEDSGKKCVVFVKNNIVLYNCNDSGFLLENALLTEAQRTELSNNIVLDPFDSPVDVATSDLLAVLPVPDKYDDLRILSYLVYTSSTSFTESKSASAAIGFGSMCYLSDTLRSIGVKIVQHAVMPLAQCLNILGYHGMASTEMATTPQMVNNAFMFIISFGKEVDDKSFKNFQVNRAKALAQESLIDPINVDLVMPLGICQDLFYYASRQKPFIGEIANKFLIPSPLPSFSNLEKGYNTQFKLILDHALMHYFKFTIGLLEYIMNSPLLSVTKVRNELMSTFKQAHDYYNRVDEKKRPYIRLLELEGHGVLHYRNYPAVHYATFCMLKYMAPKGDSITQLKINDVGLDMATRILIAKAVTKTSITEEVLTQEALDAMKQSYPSIRFKTALEDYVIPDTPAPEAIARCRELGLEIM